MVGTVIGWVLLGLLAVLVLLFVLPVVATIRVENGQLSLKVRVLFVRFAILPARPKKHKEKKKPKKEKQKEPEQAATEAETKKKKKEKTLTQKIDMVKRLVAAGLAALRRLMRALRVYGVELVLPVHAEEASDTALRCGQIHMAIGTLRALLDGRLRVRWKRMVLIPDFTGQQSGAFFFSCKVAMRPYIIFVMGAAFLKKYLTYNRRRRSRRALKKALRAKQQAQANAAANKATTQKSA